MLPGDRVVARMDGCEDPAYVGTYLGAALGKPILFPPCNGDVYVNGRWSVDREVPRAVEPSQEAAYRVEAVSDYFGDQRAQANDLAADYRFEPESFVVFVACAELKSGVYLLAQSRHSALRRAVVTVHDDGGVCLRDSATGEIYSLADWRVLGYAWAEIIPTDGSAPDVKVRAAGIGPASIHSLV